MKRFLTLSLSLLLTTSLLAACGTNTTDPADNGTNDGTTEVTTSVNDDNVDDVEQTTAVDDQTGETTPADDNADDQGDDNADDQTGETTTGDDGTTDQTDDQGDTGAPVEIDYQALDRQVDRDEDLIDNVFDDLEDDRIDDIDEVTEIASLVFLNSDVLGQADAQDAFATLRDNPSDYTISHDGEWYLVNFGADVDTVGFRFNDNSTVDVTLNGETSQEGLDLIELANAEFDRGLNEDLLEDFAELLEENFERDHREDVFD